MMSLSTFPRRVAFIVLLIAFAGMSACVDPNRVRQPTDYWAGRVLPAIWWHPEAGDFTRLEVHLKEGKLYCYQGPKGDHLTAIAPCSTGREGHATPPGHYKILEKDPKHVSSEYGSFVDANGKIIDSSARPDQTPPPGLHYAPAPMPWFLRLTWDGVGLHQGYLPGYPASHGCIRLPTAFAQDLYGMIDVDTPVDIVP